MRFMSCVLIGGLLIGFNLARPSASEAQSSNPSPIPPTGRTTTVPRPLFSQLAQPPASKPKVVCGMTLLPGDPKIDPKIHPDMQPRGIKPAIRTLAPPMCRSAENIRPVTPPARK